MKFNKELAIEGAKRLTSNVTKKQLKKAEALISDLNNFVFNSERATVSYLFLIIYYLTKEESTWVPTVKIILRIG